MPRFRLVTAVVVAAISLTACVGGGIRPGHGGEQRWQLSGKIGLRAPRLAESAYVNWRQCDDNFTIRISGPLGQSVARIDGRGEQLTLQVENHTAMTTADPAALMQQQLGWSLPIRALRYWVRALAAPDTAAKIAGPKAQPESLLQDGWRVDYLGYHENGAITLPAKLRLSRSENLSGDNLQATLLIKEWRLGDATDCPSPAKP